MDRLIRPGERLDSLQCRGLVILQQPGGFRFGMDAVLLAHFATAHPGMQAADLGTGTGVIPLLLAAHTRIAHIDGLEIQPGMADMARRSVMLNGLEERIRILCGDLRECPLPKDGYDLVLANPPYLRLHAGEQSALETVRIARQEACCTLKQIIACAAGLLHSKGRLAMVYRPERLAELLSEMRAYQLEPKRVQLVLPRAECAPNLALVEAVKCGGPDARWLPPLVVYGPDGRYTERILNLYNGEGYHG